MNQANLRPQYLDDFQGKPQIKNNLRIFIDSAKNRKTSLDHILLYGQPGTGKTTIATIIANEFDKKIKVVQGTQLRRVPDLINVISLLTEGDFIFIDEIHAVNEECMETLYSILEDFCIDLKIGTDHNQKITRVKVPNFTLIGATTNINKIPKPLEERFPISFYFDLYNEQEILSIVERTTKILDIDMLEIEKQEIASNCKGIPRIANNLIKRIQDFKLINNEMEVKDILIQLGIFSSGLQELDIKYLNSLNNNDSLGIKSISALLDIDQVTIENKIEPYLLKNNLINKTSKGRMITKKGIDLLMEIEHVRNCKTN